MLRVPAQPCSSAHSPAKSRPARAAAAGLRGFDEPAFSPAELPEVSARAAISCVKMSIRGSILRLMARWSSCALVVLGLAVVSGASLSAQSAAAQPATAPASVDAGLAALYARLEQALVAGEPSQILAATSAAATNGDRLSAFAQSQAFARAVRAVIRERDRAPLEEAAEGTAYRMLLEVFVEYRRRPRGGADVVDRRDPDAGGRRLAPRRRRGAQLGGRPEPPRARSEPAVPRPRSRGPRRGSPAHVPERRRLRRVDRRTARPAMVVLGDGAMQFTPTAGDGADAAAHLLRRDRAARADRRRLPPLSPGRS